MSSGAAKTSAEYTLKEYRSLLPYLRMYRLKYALGLFCNFVVDMALVIMPQFIRQAVDIISSGAFMLRQLALPAASMVGLMGIVTVGRFLWRYFIHGSSRRIEAELREKLFAHLLSLSYDFYQKNKIGDLMARATNDLNAVRESIGMGFVALMDGIIMTSSILVIIFFQDAGTAVWAVIPLPFVTVLILIFGRAVGKRFRRAHETYSTMSDVVQETFSGVRVIKSFVKEWWFIKKFAGSNDDYRDANMDLVKLYGFFFPLITFLSGISVLIVLLAGGIRVASGLMSPGSLVSLFRYLQMLVWPLMGAGFVVNMIQRGAVSIGRINEIMRVVPAIRSPENPVKIQPLSPAQNQARSPEASSREESATLIDLRNLSFEYHKGKPVLEGISLSVKSGTVLGILGRTGSGKSTLIKAITRMIDPPPGTVFIKGIESAKWDLAELRRLFGVTPQDSYLFSDSIRNNIAYSLEDEKAAGPAEDKPPSVIGRAAELAALEKDFSAFRDGWETLIGERGLTLSGGQKQRTAIARSIASEREILVLDDSLSAVDAETERNILDGLFELAKNRELSTSPMTMIIISHRVSTLSRADEVIVLEKGRIIERGTPHELASRGGFYARTAELQSLGGNTAAAADVAADDPAINAAAGAAAGAADIGAAAKAGEISNG